MLRGFRRLINARLFSSSKDPQSLKDQFKKMASQQAVQTEEKDPAEDIKLKDQQKATEDLKSKFGAFRSDLSKNTGEAKSLFNKLYETAKTIKAEDIRAHFKSPSNEVEDDTTQEKQEIKGTGEKTMGDKARKEETTSKFEENSEKASESDAKGPEDSTQSSETKESVSYYKSFCKKFPRASYYTDKTGKYVSELWSQTFPTKEDKIQKLVRIHEMRKMSAEFDEKLARGEITEQDLPEWKKNALMVVEKKKSTWEKLQEKLGKSSVSDKAASILQSDSIKQVKGKIKELKDGVSDVKSMVNEAIEDSESKVLHSAKDMVKESLLETSEGRATRLMQMSDPEFNLYSMESELTQHIKDIFVRLESRDENYVQGIVSGQAKEFFDSILKRLKGNDNLTIKLTYISRINYLGSNCENKDDPKISYGFRATYSMSSKDDTEKKEHIRVGDDESVGQTGSETKRTYIATICAHPDPDIMLYRHPWKFVVFYPSNDSSRIM